MLIVYQAASGSQSDRTLARFAGMIAGERDDNINSTDSRWRWCVPMDHSSTGKE
jgi:hypothetical protein